jgi:hypothetical protein
LPEKEATSSLHLPSVNTLKEVKNKVKQFEVTAWDIAYYLDDILTETQNTLLGDFFEPKIPVRKPENPEELVLTSTNNKMIDMAKKFVRDSGM